MIFRKIFRVTRRAISALAVSLSLLADKLEGPNFIVVGTYFALLVGAELLFFAHCWHDLYDLKLSYAEQVAVVITALLPLCTFFRCIFKDPGRIELLHYDHSIENTSKLGHTIEGSVSVTRTQTDLDIGTDLGAQTIVDACPSFALREDVMNRYSYDFFLYFPKNICSSCAIIKPARSKHCSVCDRCIERFDHHCVWVNNCIGRNNIFVFILFVMSNALITVYGAIMSWRICNHRINVARRVIDSINGSDAAAAAGFDQNKINDLFATGFRSILSWNIRNNATLSCLFLFSTLTSLIALSFLGFHLAIAAVGMTTNEVVKWSRLTRDIRAKRVIEVSDTNSGQIRYIVESSAFGYSASSWWHKPSHKHENLGLNELSNQPSQPAFLKRRLIKSIWQIKNPYNLGLWRNLADLVTI